MPSLLFIGIPWPDAIDIIEGLIKQLPDDMDDAVYHAYPNDAPVYAKCGKKAPYVIIRGSDQAQAERIKDAIQQDIDCVDGPLDVEIDIIQFFPGSGKLPEDSTDR
jgi:hypothetical protein